MRGERLFERESELERIESSLQRGSEGQGAFVLIEGPPGIGKSRLLDAAAELAVGEGFTVLRCRGGPLEMDFSYGLVRQLLERELVGASPAEQQRLLAGAAERAAPALGVGSDGAPQPVEASFPVIHGLYWLVSNLAADEPLLLVVDDAHWADAPSLRFLLYLIPRLDGLPVTVVTAVRGSEPGVDAGMLSQLRSDQAAETILPPPLSRDAVASLIGTRFEAPAAPAFVDAAHEATGGNPFLLGELLSEISADGGAPSAEAADAVRGLGPETVSHSLLLRLAGLDPSCAELARALAVLGSEAELSRVAALAGLDRQAAARAADALVAANVIAEDRPLKFLHPILRESIYSDMPESERQAQHARAAGVLREQGATADALAPHLLLVEPEGDAATVASLREAAAAASKRGAADLAQRYLCRALDEPPEAGVKAEVLDELGGAQSVSGEDVPAAIAHLEQAVELSEDPEVRASRVVNLSRTILAPGDLDRGYEVLKRHSDEIGDAGGEEVLRMRAFLGSMAMIYPPLVDRTPAQLERFTGLDDPSVPELLHVSNLATWRWLDGDAEESGALAEEALADGRLLASETADSFPVSQAVWVLIYADRQELAQRTLDDALADTQRRGSGYGFTSCSAMRAIAAWWRGDVSGCEAEARNALELDMLPPIVVPMTFTYLALALIARGELDEAERAVTESGCGPYLPKLVHFNPAFYARAQLRLAQGRPEEAIEDALELGDRDAELELVNPGIPWRTAASDAQVALDQPDEAVRLATEQLEHARRWGTASAIGAAQRGLGMAKGADGLADLEAAVQTLAESPARLDHARALVDLGGALRRGGMRKEARDPLREGLDAARGCGATALVERAHAELVIAGARPRRLMFSGAESLTASERRVAAMAADGQSNRDIAQALFITVKTVETHLSRAYNKLGISSRKDIAAALSQSPESP